MGKKIKVVDIAKEETVSKEEEPTQVTDEVIPEQVNEEPVVDVQPAVQSDIVEKPKAKPRSKKKEVTPPEVPTEVVPAVAEVLEPSQPVEVTKEEVKTEKIKKVVEQVKCKKCNKSMTPKTLRYSHEQNCSGAVVNTEDLPVKRRTTKKVEPASATTTTTLQDKTNQKEIYNKIVAKNVNIDSSEIDIPEELKQEVFKSFKRQQERVKMKEDNLNRLRMQIA
jgi:hypothetical protein